MGESCSKHSCASALMQSCNLESPRQASSPTIHIRIVLGAFAFKFRYSIERTALQLWTPLVFPFQFVPIKTVKKL